MKCTYSLQSDMHFITQPAYLIWLTHFLCAGCSRTPPSLVQTGSLLRISNDDALTLVDKLKMLEDSKEVKDFDAREGGHVTAPAKLLLSNREAQLRQQLARQASVTAKDSFPGSGPCRWNGSASMGQPSSLLAQPQAPFGQLRPGGRNAFWNSKRERERRA